MRSQHAYPDPGPEEVGWKAALRRAAHDVAAKHELWELSVEARDRLIMEAYDDKVPVSEIAGVALVAKSRVMQVVAEQATAEGRDN